MSKDTRAFGNPQFSGYHVYLRVTLGLLSGYLRVTLRLLGGYLGVTVRLPLGYASVPIRLPLSRTAARATTE